MERRRPISIYCTQQKLLESASLSVFNVPGRRSIVTIIVIIIIIIIIIIIAVAAVIIIEIPPSLPGPG